MDWQHHRSELQSISNGLNFSALPPLAVLGSLKECLHRPLQHCSVSAFWKACVLLLPPPKTFHTYRFSPTSLTALQKTDCSIEKCFASGMEENWQQTQAWEPSSLLRGCTQDPLYCFIQSWQIWTLGISPCWHTQHTPKYAGGLQITTLSPSTICMNGILCTFPYLVSPDVRHHLP